MFSVIIDGIIIKEGEAEVSSQKLASFYIAYIGQRVDGHASQVYS